MENHAEMMLKTITDAANAGKTVYICTYTRAWKVTKKIIDKWDRAGIPLFKLSGNCLSMGNGKRRDCICNCGIKIA